MCFCLPTTTFLSAKMLRSVDKHQTKRLSQTASQVVARETKERNQQMNRYFVSQCLSVCLQHKQLEAAGGKQVPKFRSQKDTDCHIFSLLCLLSSRGNFYRHFSSSWRSNAFQRKNKFCRPEYLKKRKAILLQMTISLFLSCFSTFEKSLEQIVNRYM